VWFGGLYGTTEGDACDVDDPLVAGHAHDGAHQDGHAQKINLVDHVIGQLRNDNLADNAVIKRNVQSFLGQSSAIPEFEIVDGSTYYYLDLSALRSEILASGGAHETTLNVTSNSPGDFSLDDFVFGSDSLDDDADATHDNRFMFDKSKGAFRAGTVTGVKWDDAVRGIQSTGFGRDNTTAAARATVAGGDSNNIGVAGTQSFIGAGSSNSTAAIESFIGAGTANSIASTATNASIVSGNTNSIDAGSNNSIVGSGASNQIGANSTLAVISGGSTNLIDGVTGASIVGGASNSIGDQVVVSTYSFIGGGNVNIILGERSVIAGGTGNTLTGARSVITGGEDNVVGGTSDHVFMGGGFTNVTGGDYQVLVGGLNNAIDGSANSIIVGGSANTITDGQSSIIVGGTRNIVTGTTNGGQSNFIGGGTDNVIDASSVEANFNVIGGGENNVITANSAGFGSYSSTNNVIAGGDANTINDSRYSVISGGFGNKIEAPIVTFLPHYYSVIRGGGFNTVDLSGGFSDIGGSSGRGYMHNQFAIGGGYWATDVDVDLEPSPRGQAQTSVLVASTSCADTGVATQLFLDLVSSSGLMFVPADHSIICEISLVARSSDATSKVAGRKYFFTLRREGSGAAAVLVDTLNDHSMVGDGMTVACDLNIGVLGLVMPRATITGTATFPVRVVAKIEWTQVYLGA
jgi:hypothetical protein